MDFITTSAQNLAPAATFVARKRVALFGDSQLALGYKDNNSTTSVGQFVVSDDVTYGRIATITQGSTGPNYFGVGNYVNLQTLGDPTFTLALNGACLPILTKPSSTSFTVSATYGGQTMAVGDYSNPLSSGKFWVASSPSWRTDWSLFNWMRMLGNDPYDVTGIYAVSSQLGTTLPYQVAKSLYGPPYEVAVISVGTNDMQAGTSAAATAACYKVFYTLQQSVATLQAAGKQIIVQLPIPDSNANSNTLPKAEAEAIFRKLVSNWAGKNNVLVIDAYAQLIDGTVATGAAITAWSQGSHLNTIGMYNLSKINSIQQVMNQNPYNIDYQPVSIIEDNATYAQTATAWSGGATYIVGDAVRNGQNVYYCTTGGQAAASGGPTGTGSSITDNTVTWAYAGPNSVNIVSHGLMDGTGGSNNTSAVFTGTVPTGWSLGKSGTFGAGSVTTANNTRTSITGTQSANWGKEWYLSCVFSAAGEQVNVSQDINSRMVAGNWYQFGITLTAKNSWSTLVNYIRFYILDGGGSYNFYPQAIHTGNTGAASPFPPLVANDVIILKSEPFYYPSYGNTTSNFRLELYSAAAGTVQFALSSAWCRVVPNPNI